MNWMYIGSVSLKSRLISEISRTSNSTWLLEIKIVAVPVYLLEKFTKYLRLYKVLLFIHSKVLFSTTPGLVNLKTEYLFI